MNVAAYCRVSTDKKDQINSLETQKNFFEEYAERKKDNMVKIYADEGISGTKVKNRKQFLQMLRDAERGFFEKLLVKDASRMARNTVDFLQGIRKLKSLGVDVEFVTYNMTVLEQSEFALTICAAQAQEESANMSKKVKFGKKFNAERGRVPNIVYGYDKTPGKYFKLDINEQEAEIVRQIFKWYTEEGYGSLAIATKLNEMNIRTKRHCKWSQHAIGRILKHDIYTGKIINGKEEVEDFLTGKRRAKDPSEWDVVERPELRIISDETFAQAQKNFAERYDAFHMTSERYSNRYPFSRLIKCKDCGRSFRRQARGKKKIASWICSNRNYRGVDACPNASKVKEEELMDIIQEMFENLIADKEMMIKRVKAEFTRIYKKTSDNFQREKELKKELNRLQAKRERYIEMRSDGLLSREEAKAKNEAVHKQIDVIENELKIMSCCQVDSRTLEMRLANTFKTIEDIVDVRKMDNVQLKKIIDRIEVDKSGQVKIFLHLLEDLHIDEDVLICDNRT